MATDEQRQKWREAYKRRAAKLPKKQHHNRGFPVVVSRMLASAKYRAKRDGIPFTITHSDILLPTHCPILGYELSDGRDGRVKPNSPSLDRVDPALGYTPGNVRVISSEANRLKDANTVATLTKLLAYCRGDI